MSDESTKDPTPADATGPTVRAAPHETPNLRLTISDTQMAVSAPDGTDADLPRPKTHLEKLPTGIHENGVLGRFTILDILGAGGMGVVLAAYDPQLDRKVAIKVLRTRGLTGKRHEKEAARLLREARSMAQLSHANVITVYEAGTIDERVYIAMEYVDGQTLRSWLAAQPRSVTEILEVYVKAGRGLAAGHSAGLVHRDFKPDNVLVGNDGRVRVIDFGLARPTRQAQIDTPAPGTPGADELETAVSSSSFSSQPQLTTVGTLFGTPMYMAPEQHDRAELDARADQFAFCVALFEALFGRMPFKADSYAELADRVTHGKLDLPDDNPEIPKRVVDVVLRGLRPNPDERFPSMDALLEALQPPARRRGLAIVSGALVAVAAAAITLVVVRFAMDRDPVAVSSCGNGNERLNGVWDAGVKQRVKTAFLASGRNHAGETFVRVEAALDQYARHWVDRHLEVCEATQVRRVAFDLRMRCLGERLYELSALTSLLAAKPDAQIVDHAVETSQQLPKLDRCLTMTPETAGPQPDSIDPVVLDELDRESARLVVYTGARKYTAAVELARALLVRVKPLKHLPYEAKIQYWLGYALDGVGNPAEAERALREALRLAVVLKDDAFSANVWIPLISVIGRARYADAVALQPAAELAILRAGGGKQQLGQLAYVMGTAHIHKADYVRAIELFRAALALQTAALGEHDRNVAQTHNSLGAGLLKAGDVDGATKELEKALEIFDKVLGKDHPDNAFPLANLGAVAQARGRLDEATPYFERAVKILEDVHGPDDVNVGLTTHNLGELARGRKDCATAVVHYARALAIFEKLGPNPYIAYPLVGRAHCRVELETPRDGIADGERALAILGPVDPAQAAEARFALARALWAAKQDRPRAQLLANEARKALAAAGPAGAAVLAEVDAWLKVTATKP